MDDMNKYLSFAVVAIIAPAGYGKTEAITQMVGAAGGKQLVLTHTRAGVAALKHRLKKYKIDTKKYEVSTIASFCLKWCEAYPHTAGVPLNIRKEVNIDYNCIYIGTREIFNNKWALKIIKCSYDGIFIDEYQDCVSLQHSIFMQLRKVVPMRIFGDPLQAIFYWVKYDEIVKWDMFDFQSIQPLTVPWRWKNTNPILGDWLTEKRNELLPALEGTNVKIWLSDVYNCVKIISSDDWDNGRYAFYIKNYQSVVYLSTIENVQRAFARRTGGFFQSDEIKDLSDIRKLLDAIDKKIGPDKALAVLELLTTCVTKIKTEFASYINNLKKGKMNFCKIKKYKDTGATLVEIATTGRYISILNLIIWFIKSTDFKVYRKEFLYKICKIYKTANDEHISVLEAINLLEQNNTFMEKRMNIPRMSSRTVLTKGLEFECVIVDLRNEIDARDLYVALTRATKFIYIISDKDSIKCKGIVK